MPANKKNAIPSSKIDWAAVDSAPLADVADDDSPELDDADFVKLKPLREVLPDAH